MLKSLLVQTNPWRDLPCTDPQCSTCAPGKGARPGQCKIRSVVYQNSCTPCQTKGDSTKYIGETGRTMLERGKEHQRDALGRDSKSHMKEHILRSHPDRLEDILDSFRMTLLKSCPSALSRMVREAVEIARGGQGTLLNSKDEYNRCLLPTMTIEGPKPIRQQEQEDTPSVEPLSKKE